MKRLICSPDSAEMGLLKSRLEDAGIPCVLRDEQISQAIFSAAFSAELWIVNAEDYRRAVDLCQAWQHPAFEGRPAWTCPKCGETLEGQFSACWKCGTKPNIYETEQTEATGTMNKQTEAIKTDLGRLAEDARALMVATADVAGGTVSQARKRLTDALDSGKTILGRLRTKAIEGGKATDQAVHEHPYPVIGIAFGVGAALIGYLVARWCSRHGA